jgi:hypothetical protein
MLGFGLCLMSRADELADAFLQVHREVLSFVARCDDRAWAETCQAEGWPVGALINHIADGYARSSGWLRSYAAGQAVSYTAAENDANNAHAAAVSASRSRAQTRGRLEENAAEALELMRWLTPEQLDVALPFGLAGGAALSAEQLCTVLERHTLRHLISAQAAADAMR